MWFFFYELSFLPKVCDKLCSAFGHDILDSLFSKAVAAPFSTSPTTIKLSQITHFVVALFYIYAHSTVLFYQVMTLNVAVNSYSNSLLTLLMSNQFVEIKGSVFKKFEKENVFQLSCSGKKNGEKSIQLTHSFSHSK